MSNRKQFLSLGMGTQSCALGLMSAAGDLPKLDGVIFADTQGELPETYSYLEYMRTQLEAADIPLYVVTAGSLEEAMLNGGSKANPTPPAHFIHAAGQDEGKKGRIGSYRCSYDFKRRLIEAQLKRLCGKPGAWKRTTVEQWIGFSTDEQQRMKQSSLCRCGHKRVVMKDRKAVLVHAPGCSRCDCQGFDPWLVNRWPLIELRMRREDTIRWFSRHGHPTPPRSACWFCPNQGNGRWQALRSEHPDLFERACRIDETIRDVTDFKYRDRTDRGLYGGQLYLHGSCGPLRDADLRTGSQVLADAGHLPLFDDVVLGEDCKAEVCFT